MMVKSIIILAVLFAVFAIISYKYKLYKIEYDSKKKSHKALLILATGFFAVLSFVIFGLLSTKSLSYPYSDSLSVCNAYEQMFDAFMKHQLNIDITPDPILSIMNNPYDRTERTALGVNYLWDRAFYNGNYYSYFGIAPLLVVYFPFWLITKKVPTSPTSCFILSLAAIVVIALLVIKAEKVFLKKVNLWLLALSIAAVEGGSLILMAQSSADMYYVPVCSGILFLALFLFFSICAYDGKSQKARCVYFALSALALTLLVMSRPNMAVYVLIIIPVYLSVLFSKTYSAKQKVVQVISFMVPALIGAAVVMWYNYARFGSVFEFGAKYQLTVYDVSQYHLTAALILPSIYYFFFQFMQYSRSAPHIIIPFSYPMSYTGYIYATPTIGALSFPSAWGFIALISSLLSKEKNPVKKSVFLLSFVSVLLLAFADICLGGINIRYLADIMLVTMLFTSLMLIDFYNIFEHSKPVVRYIIWLVICALFILSFVLGIILIFVNERNYIVKLFS